MPDAIDIHGHAMPRPVLDWLASQGLADVSALAEHVVRIDPRVSGVRSGTPIPVAPSMTDASLRVDELDGLRLTAQAVSLPPFLMASTCVDPALAVEVASRGNDALADYCATDPDRLLPLGLIPIGWPDAAEEARRCLDDLGMRGLAIGSRGAGRDLDDPANAELWDFLGERRAFVFLHPSAVPEPTRLSEYWFPQLVGYPMETAIAAARLVFAGVVRDDAFHLCLAHGGGCLSALGPRLDLGWERKAQAQSIAVPPRDVLRTLFYDTAVFDAVALRRLVEDVGGAQVLIGTDHPFDLAERDPVGLVDRAGLSATDRESVLAGNARRLLGLA